MNFPVAILLGAAAVLSIATANRAAADIGVRCREEWSAAFADEDVPLKLVIHSNLDQAAVVVWQHMASDHRTISRGERRLMLKSNEPTVVELTLRTAELRPGVIWESRLEVNVSEGEKVADGKSAAILRKPIWLFPRDAFTQLRPTLNERRIQLFDPLGATADIFSKAEIPHRRLRNPEQIAADQGLIVVGEGVSLEKQPGLADLPVKLAAGGARVLFLAPQDGNLSLSDVGGPLALPEALILKGRTIICEFDHRLDWRVWPQGGPPPVRSFLVSHDDDQVQAAVSDARPGWPWLELRYAGLDSPPPMKVGTPRDDSGGRLILCGFRVIENWDNGPTPRYLLARVLEQLNEPHAATEPADPLHLKLE